MLSADDKAQFASDLSGIIDDNPVMVTLRRGDTTLAAQKIRIVRAGSRAVGQAGMASDATRQAVILYGAGELDVQQGDRLTHDGHLYEVTFVRPSLLIGTVAEAEAVK
jgi:hypothetical protein